MTVDIAWLSQEAKNIHHTLESFFYGMVTVLLLIGVLVEYVKLPLGKMPSFGTLVGRVLIAVILLQSYPMICNTIATVSDELAKNVGDINKFDIIRERLGHKFSQMNLSWLSVKESITIILCYTIFVLFHFSYYLAESFLCFAWTLLYVLSPVLIALFVLPSTSSATRGLFRSLIEVGFWKPVWSILATLLWSLSLSEINRPQGQMNFLSVISLVLILAAALILTPIVVHYLAGAGIATMAPALGKLGLSPVSVSHQQFARVLERVGGVGGGIAGAGFKNVYNSTLNAASRLSPRSSRVGRFFAGAPRFSSSKSGPIFERKKENS